MNGCGGGWRTQYCVSMDYARKDELSKRHVISRYRAVEAWWAGACVDSDYARKRQTVKMARSEQVQGEGQRAQITRRKDKQLKWRVVSRYRAKGRERKLRAIKG